ncbi:MAG: hypothetical protein R3B83_06020 [Nitrospirales bacterium]|nr:hypothetical protein [Nitrospirales bacterium]
MAISSELMYAILAMDAYNRGYNPGMVLTGLQIGTATISTDSTREFRDPGADPEDSTLTKPALRGGVYMEWRHDHGVPAPKAVAQALVKELEDSCSKPRHISGLRCDQWKRALKMPPRQAKQRLARAKRQGLHRRAKDADWSLQGRGASKA